MRAFNFSPGPAVLPLEVLEQARDELLDWQRSGMSVMEVSHRGKAFMQVAAEAEADLRELHGDTARTTRCCSCRAAPRRSFPWCRMNLDRAAVPPSTTSTPGTGRRGRSPRRAATARCTSPADAGGDYTARAAAERVRAAAATPAYVHYTPNETISGVEFRLRARTGRGVPLVADMSSSILSRPIDVSKFGLIYAGAQKNIGPSGLTVVIVREDLLGHARAETPQVFDYQAVADERSMLNTPPTFAWYMAGLVFKWLKRTGRPGRHGRAQPGQGRRRCMPPSTARRCTAIASRRTRARG